MAVFSFHDTKVRESIEGLHGFAKDLSIKVYNLLICIGLEKMMSSKIEIFPEYNHSAFLLISDNDEAVEFKIDIYEKYHDLFVNDEEVFIQQKNLDPDKSLGIIEEYLKSSVEVILIETEDCKVLRKEINFYIKGKIKDAIASGSFFYFLYRNRREMIFSYDPWIDS